MEENFENAMLEAISKDKEREEAKINGKLDELPPLHGIPFSMKDNVSHMMI